MVEPAQVGFGRPLLLLGEWRHSIGVARSTMLKIMSPLGLPVFLSSKSVTLAAVML